MKKDTKRLTVDDRLKIQVMVTDSSFTISKIARILKVSKSTISRELKRNCEIKAGYETKCYRLPKCGVCNSCERRTSCPKMRRFYFYRSAQEKSENRASTSRSFSKLSQNDLSLVDDIVWDGTLKGQSLHHIYVANPVLHEICCERTIRRMCYRGELKTKCHHLKKYVRYKRSYKKEYKDIKLKNPRILIGRTYSDFTDTINKNGKSDWVEYDSVVGKLTDKKSILTITFPKEAFQFGLVVAKGNPDSVLYAIKKLFRRIGEKYSNEIFQINLADNGSEFSKFNEIEYNQNGEIKRKTFFTNPYKSTDKAHCERNHEFIRYVIPKGISLDFITQDFLDEMFSNINSYVRLSRNDKTPYELIEAKYGKEFLELINIKKIDKRKVKLTPIA